MYILSQAQMLTWFGTDTTSEALITRAVPYKTREEAELAVYLQAREIFRDSLEGRWDADDDDEEKMNAEINERVAEIKKSEDGRMFTYDDDERGILWKILEF